MASASITPYHIHISPDKTGLLELKQTDEASKKVSELLQKDLEVALTYCQYQRPHTYANNRNTMSSSTKTVSITT